MIYTHAAAALVAGALAFGSAWQIQNWRADAHEKQTIERAAEQERKLHAVEQAGREAVIHAQNAARTREAKLRTDAANARNALSGLRAATDSAMPYARADHEACVVSAAATSELLNQCGAEYQGLAEKADRHVSDVQTLMDSDL